LYVGEYSAYPGVPWQNRSNTKSSKSPNVSIPNVFKAPFCRNFGRGFSSEKTRM